MKQLRLYIAEKMLSIAFWVMPESDSKIRFALLLEEYITGSLEEKHDRSLD